MADSRCVCGLRLGYAVCCRPLHSAETQAATAETLMRSRYAAFVLGDSEYLWRTWHPRTRPKAVILDPEREWTGLQITDVVGGSEDDDSGTVEFTASYRHTDGSSGEQHERSRFERRAGRWFYVDGS